MLLEILADTVKFKVRILDASNLHLELRNELNSFTKK